MRTDEFRRILTLDQYFEELRFETTRNISLRHDVSLRFLLLRCDVQSFKSNVVIGLVSYKRA